MDISADKRRTVPPHPRQEPRIELPLTEGNIRKVFADCVDFSSRPVLLGGDPALRATLYFIIGMVKTERVGDYVLLPLLREAKLVGEKPAGAFRMIAGGLLYNLTAQMRTTMDEVVFDLIGGACVLAFPDLPEMLSFSTATEEKRSIGNPENEPGVKAARDSFVESLRTNTSLVRRRLRAPTLKIKEHIVGRQSVTPVDVLYLEGLTNPETVRLAEERIAAIDIDALVATGSLEEYITDRVDTAFPLIASTERPDRFCAGLAEGRVGILAEGLPLGYLVPGTIQQFFKTGEDKSSSWMMATAIMILRWVCMMTTLFLPGLYIAAVTFHPEIIPIRLARSMIAAKTEIPFSTPVEVLLLLLAFEILQEAGLRLPASVGKTISILGGLVVGMAAVEARIVSPSVLIVVSIAGVAGYTMPSQDFADALKIWRFLLAVAGSFLGLFGVALGGVVLICRLAGLESFGVAYLTPFAAKDGEPERHALIRQPLPSVKLREKALRTLNRRNQK